MRIIFSMYRTSILILLMASALAISTAPRINAESLVNFSETLQEITTRVSPAVVQIIVAGYTPGTPGSAGLLELNQSSGSGVIVDPDGYIVTNAHVVAGARRIQVLLAASHTAGNDFSSILKPRGDRLGAQVVGIDRETDLAVLKVQQEGLPYLELGDSDKLRQGQLVLAFGSPRGLENSVTIGVVSSVARQLVADDPMIYIQTDASINPGNSGGPLVNVDGEVVGINTFIVSESGGNEGLGFAAPSNIVRNIYEQFRNTGYVRRGVIGVNAQTITPDIAQGLGLNRDWGVVLGDVYPNSPAEQAGLQVGDIILSVDGKTMENGRQFDVNLYRRTIGERVRLEVQRDGAPINVEVMVIERVEEADRFSRMVSPEDNLVDKLGILALELDDNIRSMLPELRRDDGVVVAARSNVAAAFRTGGFLPGDVIYAVNRQAVGDLTQLREALSGHRTGQVLVVQIERLGRLMYLPVLVQ